jgi:hypothetical protein
MWIYILEHVSKELITTEWNSASPCSYVELVHSTHFELHRVACVGHKWLEIVYQSDLDNTCIMKFM